MSGEGDRGDPGDPGPRVTDAAGRRTQDRRSCARRGIRRGCGPAATCTSTAHCSSSQGGRRGGAVPEERPDRARARPDEPRLGAQLRARRRGIAAGDVTFTAEVWAIAFEQSDEPDPANNLMSQHVEFHTAEVPTVMLMALDDGAGPGPAVGDVNSALSCRSRCSCTGTCSTTCRSRPSTCSSPVPVLPGAEAVEPGLWDVGLDADVDATANTRAQRAEHPHERDRRGGWVSRRVDRDRVDRRRGADGRVQRLGEVRGVVGPGRTPARRRTRSGTTRGSPTSDASTTTATGSATRSPAVPSTTPIPPVCRRSARWLRSTPRDSSGTRRTTTRRSSTATIPGTRRLRSRS